MASAHERLLARYLDAATNISQPTLPQHFLKRRLSREEPAPANITKLQSSQTQSSLSGSKQDVPDPSVSAMTELLARQASILIAYHNSLAAGGEGRSEFHEELFKKRINDLISISTSKFYSYRFDLLPSVWRQIYTDSFILDTHHLLLGPLLSRGQLPDEILDAVVEKLDRALIVAGGGSKGPWIEETLGILEDIWRASPETSPNQEAGRPSKRQRRGSFSQRTFSSTEPYSRPSLDPDKECPRYSGWTLEQFEDYMNNTGGAPSPIVFTDLIKDWPALTDCPWKNPDYLLSQTFGGRRLVPVELGRSYVDDGWGQDLIPFRNFITQHIMNPPPSSTDSSAPVGYLAQHNLFRQIPSLRNDIQVPDFCWVDVPPHPTDSSLDQPPVDVPQLNAWFGPARTITPLHTDGYHNLLCQAVGTKYLRLYPPQATTAMRPRTPEHGVDMSNTSALDVGVLEGWDERPEGVSEEDVEEMKRALEGVDYRECILGPGDTLVIPIGWWHYVRSLSVSFSVSFWWN